MLVCFVNWSTVINMIYSGQLWFCYNRLKVINGQVCYNSAEQINYQYLELDMCITVCQIWGRNSPSIY